MEGFENEDYKTAQRVVEEEIVGLFRLLQKEYEYAS
jgi:hypothetical protein